MFCPHCGLRQKHGAQECSSCHTVFVAWLKNNARRAGLLRPERPAKRDWKPWLKAGRLAALFAGTFLAFHGSLRWLSHGRDQSRREAIAAPFQGRLKPLAAFRLLSNPRGDRPNCRGGRFVAIDDQTGALDEVHFQLPDGLRAAGPEEATVLVRVKRGWKLYGRRPGGTPAYQGTAEVSVYNLKDGRVTDGPMNVLGPPPSLEEDGGPAAGGPPPVQVIVTNLRAFCS